MTMPLGNNIIMPLFFCQQALLVIVIVYHVISNNLVFPYYSCCQLFNHALFRASKKFINKNTNSRMMMLLLLPKLMMIDLRCLFQWINHGDNASRAGVLFSLIQSCSISFNLAVWFFLGMKLWWWDVFQRNERSLLAAYLLRRSKSSTKRTVSRLLVGQPKKVVEKALLLCSSIPPLVSCSTVG